MAIYKAKTKPCPAANNLVLEETLSEDDAPFRDGIASEEKWGLGVSVKNSCLAEHSRKYHPQVSVQRQGVAGASLPPQAKGAEIAP